MTCNYQEDSMHSRFSSVSSALLVAAAAALLWPSSAAGQAPSFTKTGGGDGDHSRFGSSVATISDIDADGVDDVLVGEPFYTLGTATNTGRVSIFSGRTGAVLRTHWGFFGREYLGTSVARAGDIDGDGVGEYLVGVPGWVDEAGAVYVYNGRTGDRYYYSSLEAGYREGDSVAGLGDVDGDGVPDFAVGAPKVGTVTVVSGKTNQFLYVRYDPTPNNFFGQSIAGCGDLDHDGHADFVVGWPLYDNATPSMTDVGRVVLVSGKTGATITFWTGDAAFDQFGWSVASQPDLDGDGVQEILIGAPGSDAPGVQAGLVRVISGRTFGTIFSTFGGSGDMMGYSVVGLGDLNRDGVPDYAAGSPISFENTGNVRLMSGRNGVVMYLFGGVANQNGNLGGALAGGDFNQDGLADLVIGDPSFATGGKNPGNVTVFLGCPAYAENYGLGWPGNFGVPTLTTFTEPALGATVQTSVSNSLGAKTSGVLMIGYSQANTQLPSGATLLVTPSLFISLAIPAGGLTLSGQIPNDTALCFFDLYQQVIELDKAAIGGMSLTPGLHMRIGFNL
jgi:hypothetical protein